MNESLEEFYRSRLIELEKQRNEASGELRTQLELVERELVEIRNILCEVQDLIGV